MQIIHQLLVVVLIVLFALFAGNGLLVILHALGMLLGFSRRERTNNQNNKETIQMYAKRRNRISLMLWLAMLGVAVLLFLNDAVRRLLR